MSVKPKMLEELKRRLSRYHPPQNLNVQKRASVLIPLFEQEGEVYMLLTRRAGQLRTHSGQVSFPGGKADEQDQDSLATALREAHEEIGLRPEQVTILGQIDQVVSRYL